MLVSHITHRCRRIALATPQPWNKISFLEPGAFNRHTRKQTDRALSFLSRCRAFPIDVSVEHVRGDKISQDLLQLIGDHMGHCRRLCITDANPNAVEKIIQHICPEAVPFLCSIHFTGDIWANVLPEFLAPLFPSGTPHLRTAELGSFTMLSLHFCIPALQSITSLRLTEFYLEGSNTATAAYRSFRDALMALHSLKHLELQPAYCDDIKPHVPIVLPTVQFLLLRAPTDPSIANVPSMIYSFQAASLITLSLDGWGFRREISDEDVLELHFPSLEHLILLDVIRGRRIRGRRSLDALARQFPDLSRLTYQVTPQAKDHYDITDILNQVCFSPLWPKLRIVGVSAADTSLDAVSICNMASALQKSAISKFMLPKSTFALVGAHAVGKLEEVVELEEYSLDWPTPFAHCC